MERGRGKDCQEEGIHGQWGWGRNIGFSWLFSELVYWQCSGVTTGSDIGAGGEGDETWRGGGGGGGDEGGESTVDSAMTAGNCVVGGRGDATVVVVASCGLDVT